MISLDGQQCAQFSAGQSVTYYHGYLIEGITDNQLNFSTINNELSLQLSRPGSNGKVALFTSDGHQLSRSALHGLQIENEKADQQVVYTYGYDNEQVVRKGAFMLNQPTEQVPAIFGNVKRENGWWTIRVNELSNPEPYNIALHTTSTYHDLGEILYHQGKYRECAEFYHSMTDKTQAPWADFYEAAAYYSHALNRMKTFSLIFVRNLLSVISEYKPFAELIDDDGL